MSSLKELSREDKRIKYSVYGWIREMEKSLHLDYIPPIICCIVILYIQHQELFDMIADNIIISKEKQCIIKGDYVTMDRVWGNNSYGKHDIVYLPMNENIYKWTFKIIKPKTNSGVFIGISSVVVVDEDFEKHKGHHYGYLHCGTLFKNMTYVDYGITYNNNDQVTMCLNLSRKRLSYSVNGQDQGIAYHNIQLNHNTTYKMFVSLYGSGDGVEIIDFSKT